MHIKIGSFNKIPLYLNIPSPLQWFKQLFIKEKPIAFLDFKKEHNNDEKSWIFSNHRIIVYPIYLFLPKLNKLFTLWHEYGHSISLLIDDEGNRSSFLDVYEAIASFYACCKLKLHFNMYVKLRYMYSIRGSSRKCWTNEASEKFEKRYKKLCFSNELPLNKRSEEDHVYEFYRNKNNLIEWYNFCFRETCYMDYQHYFGWNSFLQEIGWDNDEERWKYISYKENVQRNIAI